MRTVVLVDQATIAHLPAERMSRLVWLKWKMYGAGPAGAEVGLKWPSGPARAAPNFERVAQTASVRPSLRARATGSCAARVVSVCSLPWAKARTGASFENGFGPDLSRKTSAPGVAHGANARLGFGRFGPAGVPSVLSGLTAIARGWPAQPVSPHVEVMVTVR